MKIKMFTLVEILTYRMVASIKETVSRQGPRLHFPSCYPLKNIVSGVPMVKANFVSWVGRCYTFKYFVPVALMAKANFVCCVLHVQIHISAIVRGS